MINMSSQFAHKVAVAMARYTATKAEVIGFAQSLGYEMRRTVDDSDCDRVGPR